VESCLLSLELEAVTYLIFDVWLYLLTGFERRNDHTSMGKIRLHSKKNTDIRLDGDI